MTPFTETISKQEKNIFHILHLLPGSESLEFALYPRADIFLRYKSARFSL